jgi:hypothetical protein
MSRRALVAVCCNERTIPHETAASLVSLGWASRPLRAQEAHGFEAIDFGWFDQFLGVDDLRNYAGEVALERGYSHLVFLDADMRWPSNVLTRLLRHAEREEIVSGVYFRKPWPHFPVAWHDSAWDEANQRMVYKCDLEVLEHGEALRAEHLIGMGCCLLPTSVLQRLGPRPWFQYARPVHGYATVTEDVPFCQAVRAAGLPLWIDPTILCEHYSATYIGAPQWQSARRYMQTLIARGELAMDSFDGQVESGRLRKPSANDGEPAA